MLGASARRTVRFGAMGRKMANAAWDALTEEEREAAVKKIMDYASFCALDPDFADGIWGRIFAIDPVTEEERAAIVQAAIEAHRRQAKQDVQSAREPIEGGELSAVESLLLPVPELDVDVQPQKLEDEA